MRGPWRAAVALALHIGFFLASIALVLGLLACAAYAFRLDPGSGIKAGLAALLVGAVLAMGLRAVLRTKVRPRGVAITRADHPKLWQLVDKISLDTDAPPPDAIRITATPDLLVREDTALVGLRTRTRFLEIGLPVLAVLNVSELTATIGHAIGRLSGRGKLTVLAYRVLGGVERTVSGLAGGAVKWLFAGYARLFTAIAATTAYELVLAGDVAAVRVAGKRNAMLALRKSLAIELGWQDFCGEYLSMATTIGHVPDVLLGFRHFMGHPERKRELAERTKQAIAADRQGHPGEPSAKVRFEALKRLPSRDRDVDDKPGFSLLRKPRQSVPKLEEGLVVDGFGERLPWPEMARKAGAAQVADQAARLSAAVEQSGLPMDPSIAGVLAAIHRGHGRDLVNPVLNPGLHPDDVDQAAEDLLTELLGATVVDALICAQRARHELDWGGPSTVRVAGDPRRPEQPLDPDRLVRPAVVNPRLVPGLHRALVGLGVPLNHARRPAAEPEPELAGIVSPVQCQLGAVDLLVTDRGLVLLPSSATTAKRLLAGTLARWREAEKDELGTLAATPVDELRDRRGAQWVDSRDVAAARLDHGKSGWSLTLELYLDEYAMSTLDEDFVREADGVSELKLHSSADGVEHGDPYGGLSELMGARMDPENSLTPIE